MNKEFVKKMIKAKKLEYEAIKELIPDNLKSKVKDFEEETSKFLKELALELIKDEVNEKRSDGNEKKVKKIGIDFN